MNRKKLVIGTCILIAIISAFTFSRVRNHIRSEQTASVRISTFNSKQIENINYRQVDQLVDDKVAAMVVFLKPNSAAGKDFLNFFQASNEIKSLKQKVYLYQMFYTDKNLKESYQLPDNQVSIIFFENGEVSQHKDFQQLPSDLTAFVNQINTLSINK
ncbi:MULTISPECIES: hypothetical protein [unclassified Enterococcus]|uniref:hypothetical protein n=1 Tax=unclassified Enterococcus TaxID=2608891 RepID=UPI0015572CB7|nr:MULTISPECIES: hypothetical protein [unclassified Enterococcus]MBS7576642.1 hypothetical protein [Enterococcus sp. MMGLQ5-2]MBS7583871.1 hypothetical protein [Enterococcus sp. MMGLQ5-1]NPD11732.1 hypothetical protein [Enterococcus sp. MMGLQ5-1]NPD36479.1 hypothetical protein [Enterococcus sp. MMGLQ5-2]